MSIVDGELFWINKCDYALTSYRCGRLATMFFIRTSSLPILSSNLKLCDECKDKFEVGFFKLYKEVTEDDFIVIEVMES